MLLGALVPTATLLAAVATVGTFVVALTRRSRLRSAEAQWRQVLEMDNRAITGAQRQVVRDLHRHSLAQLTSINLVPTRGLTIGSLLLAMATFLWIATGWFLSTSVAEHPSAPLADHFVAALPVPPEDRIVAPLVLVAAPLFGVGQVVGFRMARHRVAEVVAAGNHLQRQDLIVQGWPSWRNFPLALITAIGGLSLGVLTGLSWWQARQELSGPTLQDLPSWLPGGAIIALASCFSLLLGLSLRDGGVLPRSAPPLVLTSLTADAEPAAGGGVHALGGRTWIARVIVVGLLLRRLFGKGQR
ncbi:hypothetical protein [uncultured Serinicoccus sp.]|uniref:hypothetical protein n=1 Tax=uncultured Serinicoccus sp. TaxID=735514 RepID=UPI002623D5AE|nr:hypothetical protein [uncultured Serinicoccus sp.]